MSGAQDAPPLQLGAEEGGLIVFHLSSLKKVCLFFIVGTTKYESTYLACILCRSESTGPTEQDGRWAEGQLRRKANATRMTGFEGLGQSEKGGRGGSWDSVGSH